VGYAEAVSRELGLAVVDPSSAALTLTAAMVAAGLRHSKRGLYAKPRPKEFKKR